MAEVTNTTQISLFPLVRTVLRTNSTISGRFQNEDIYEFEPKHKSPKFHGFPYIVVNIPATETDLLTLNHSTNLKDFTAEILLRVEYGAPHEDNFRNYVNAIISAIESGATTFEASGYYDTQIDLLDVNSDQILDEKELVEATFSLSFKGGVTR